MFFGHLFRGLVLVLLVEAAESGVALHHLVKNLLRVAASQHLHDLVNIHAAAHLLGKERLILPRETMMGALADYVANSPTKDFQPMGANFGVLPPIEPHIRDKRSRYAALSQRGLAMVSEILSNQE